jgi:UDP-3-O-acyl N-acetylglucosamine deacetylase
VSARQTTLAGGFEFDGVGVHSGAPARLHVSPAPAGSGFAIASAGERIPALAEYVCDTRRATTLGVGDRRVSTVEHLLSALFGMGVDNALIALEGPEFPIADGSAAEFADAILRAGVVEQEPSRVYLTIDEPIAIRDGEAIVIALPAPDFTVRVAVDHGVPIGAHTFSAVVDPHSYRAEIAGARTYCTLLDAQRMREMGLVRGGSLERALVFGDEGPLTPLRWQGEPARHKALDLIGDLALVGARLRGEFVAFKSGHTTHARMAAALRSRLRSGWKVPA